MRSLGRGRGWVIAKDGHETQCDNADALCIEAKRELETLSVFDLQLYEIKYGVVYG